MSCWHTAYCLRESFIDENWKVLNGIPVYLTERDRGEERNALQSVNKGDMHFSLLGMCTLARGQAKMFMAHLVLNASVPMCHLCFSLGRDEIPKSTVM